MRAPALLGAAVLAAVAALPARAAPVHHRAAHPAAPASRDWSRTVVATPQGGFRMGNPAARVKLVEYGSLTCPHCGHFAQTGVRPLVTNFVRTGKVSYEFRNYILNGIDVTASLLARCSGSRFFAMAETLYATQPQWVGKVAGLPQAQKEQLANLTDARRLSRIAQIAGLTQIAGRFGVSPQRATACLADKAGFERLGKMSEAANALGVNQTPTFFVNGAKTEAASWEELEPLIRKAGG